jgi:hypothetical protein
MKRFLGSAALVAIAAIGVPVATATQGSASAPTTRSFKGSSQGITNVDSLSGVRHATSVGTITSNLLGRGNYTVVTLQLFGDDTNDVCPGSPFVADVSGTATLQAAQGDTVTGTVVGTVCDLAPFNQTTLGSRLIVTVTGGTGKFAGTTGSVLLDGTSTTSGADGMVFTDSSNWTGTLSK